ncbi:PREDICTED: uncharacterized protein LOC108561951 [Nicrophorus vespilloides]|uniref:Uncharacterized protein LOC108561951 n=1 Tax=Nicrophorus vespilloides TaxID=110193 RepID=A0ABM1MLZ5_NICVS|nr:PREDICTED: uncharacterized protein LOC108561951 [Nicrophorus vespilloides]
MSFGARNSVHINRGGGGGRRRDAASKPRRCVHPKPFDATTPTVSHPYLHNIASYRMLLVWWYLVAAFSVTDALLLQPMTAAAVAKETWQKPGCHKIGHTRKISIPNCIEIKITTNACRGYCESWAVPSSTNISWTQPVTSVGECCNIMDSELQEVQVFCVEGVRTLTFKSAISCSCYHCRKY